MQSRASRFDNRWGLGSSLHNAIVKVYASKAKAVISWETVIELQLSHYSSKDPRPPLSSAHYSPHASTDIITLFRRQKSLFSARKATSLHTIFEKKKKEKKKERRITTPQAQDTPAHSGPLRSVPCCSLANPS